MKRMLVVACVGVVCACQGPTGPRGETGPQGPPGPALASNGWPLWKDARGNIGAYGDPPRHYDARLNWWFIDLETGQADVARHQVGAATSEAVEYFAATGCSGDAYMLPPTIPFVWPAARVPFKYRNETVYRVRRDGTRVVDRTMLSSRSSAGCVDDPSLGAWATVSLSDTMSFDGPARFLAEGPLYLATP